MPPIDVQNFILPELPIRESEGLVRLNQTMQQNKEFDYQKQRQAEADQWRKLHLVRELTDLSKYQTSSDVANAVGNKKAAEILQKYSTSNLPPEQLQYEIAREMNGITTGMQSLKTELDQKDEQLKLLKQNIPDLDISKLERDYRADILDRRMQGENFVNPIEVKPSEFNIGDPYFLSRYTMGNKNLTNSIINPQGTEQETVLVGKQGDYTKFEGKIPFWMKRNYDPSKFNSEGFYSGKELPSLSIKSSVLPPESLPSSNGKPFEIIDEDVYRKFTGDTKGHLELIADARKLFPGYDNFNQQEKEYAERNTLFRNIKSLDQNQLHPTFSTKPARTNIYNNNSKDKTNQPLDLSNYNKDGDFYDVTELAQGINVNRIGASSLGASKVLYNPKTKMVSYEDVKGNKKQKSFSQFRQDIATINTGVDLSFIDRLGISGGGSGQQSTPKQDSPKSAQQYSSVTSGTYNGKKVQIGQKNGKWYNIQTGEEIK